MAAAAAAGIAVAFVAGLSLGELIQLVIPERAHVTEAQASRVKPGPSRTSRIDLIGLPDYYGPGSNWPANVGVWRITDGSELMVAFSRSGRVQDVGIED